MRPYRYLRLILSTAVLAFTLLASLAAPPPLARAAAPLCGSMIQYVSGAISSDTTWSPTYLYVFTGDVTVNAGVTLMIQPGTVIKANLNTRLIINGTLTANGTAANPIYFTSFRDDGICGDTNANGSTNQPTAGDWGFILFNAGSSISSLTRAVLRYGGLSSWGNTASIVLSNASPTLGYLSMAQNFWNAAQLTSGSWNTATLASTTVVYLLSGDLTVNSNQTFTIAKGAKVKATALSRLIVNGKLSADGSLTAPIYFTSVKDDSVCGVGASGEQVCDTNNALDGPAPQDWGFILFNPSSNTSSSLTRAVLRYGGLSSWGNTAPLILSNASPTLDYLSMEQNFWNAAQLAGGGWNTATLASTTVVYLLAGDLTVNSNQTFTIGAGVKVKATAQSRLFVNGKLTADGTPSAPISFTSVKDDTICGYGAKDELVCDTNNAVDGPAPQDWGFILFNSGSNSTSSLTRAVLRYGGLSSWGLSAPIILRNASPTLSYLSMAQNFWNAAQLSSGGWNTATLASTTVVYLLAGDLTVNSGQTLTVAPGVKIKATPFSRLFVNGKLIADGTPATDVRPATFISFTSVKDDTICGIGASDELVCDSDNAVDGPAARDWGYINLSAGSNSSSSLSWADLRYGGQGSGTPLSGVLGVNSSPSIAYVRFQQNYIGMDLGNGAQPTLSCNDFVGNEAFGMRNVQPATPASATGQWWGATSGPTYAGNPTGKGQKISDGIAYSPWASAECAPHPQIPPTKWLVLLYLAGDNQASGTISLSGPMKELLARLNSMTYNPNMRLVVLLDGDNKAGGDTQIYTREPGGMVDVTELAAKSWLGGMGGSAGAREIDSGKAASLSNFTNWAIQAYPGAAHTMLSIVDHGGGWAPTIGLPGQPRGAKYILAGSWRGMNLDLSASGGSALSTRDLGQALRNTGHVDVLFLDACLMGMLETAYEVSNYADYLVSSENLLFANLPYETYLAKGGLTNTTSPLGLARRLVTKYNEGAATSQPYAISLVDLAQIRAGVPGSAPVLLNKLAEKLLAALPAAPAASDPLVQAITQAYSQAQKFDYDSTLAIDPHDGYVDLADFAGRLRDSPSLAVPAEVRAAAGDLAAAVTGGATPAIDTSRVNPGSYNGVTWNLSGASGLAIFLPLGERDYRPTLADPLDPGKAFQAERQLSYYANPNQLLLSHDAPLWAELLVRLEPTVSIIRTGPGGLPTQPTATLADTLAATTVDKRPFYNSAQIIGDSTPPPGGHHVYLPLIRR